MLRLVLLVSLLAPPLLAAEDDARFNAATEAAASGAGPSFAHIRCAALMRSVMDFGGREALGPHRWARAERAAQHLADRATDIRIRVLAEPPAAARLKAMRDIRAVSATYLDRFEAWRRAHGVAWVGDALFAADMQTCVALADG